ncbi:MAG TPA: dihydrolipoyl dehydrogenase [Dokdonella sp.]|uniref:dihydrolipoyl dehydrogenase n=1 Tax=Dokdonella sp. TaxID=2291710 RepID=UPI002D7FC11F|nr:dihydrolipoyl dehydrogenase [Dokdonella sp.]HET9031377.1 dihydrolipoyl dehydrogenase [Dokdonella sp.]
MSVRNVDVAIIGAGTAGMSAYHQVRKSTDRIALIEGGPFGTTCARVGCMPSKLLIAPAEARHRLQVLPEFGIAACPGEVDGVAVMRRVRFERDRFVGFVKDAVEGFEQKHIIRAHAEFEDAHTLRLSPTDDVEQASPEIERIKAERIIIATGSRPMIPEPFKAVGDRLIVNDDVFNWQDLPESVAVFGAGVIGIELGQALHRLGVRVHLFGRDGAVGGISDPDVRSYAARTFAAEWPVSFDPRDVRISRDGDAVVVDFIDDQGAACSERFEWLLAATGRVSNVDRLALHNSGLKLGARGIPLFDPLTMQTSEKHIFIAGDSAAYRPVLHEAADEGHLAGQNAANYPEVFRHTRRTPLGIVFSDPQIAFAGQRHAELVEGKVDFAVGEVSFENQGRSRVLLVNQGLLRVYGERGTGLLLGAEMIGPANEHLAHLIAWVIQMRMTVGQIIELPFYHPVIEEGLRTALRMLNKSLGMGPKPPPNCIDCGPGG